MIVKYPDREGEEHDSYDGDVGQAVHPDHHINQVPLLHLHPEHQDEVDNEDGGVGANHDAPMKWSGIKVTVNFNEVSFIIKLYGLLFLAYVELLP